MDLESVKNIAPMLLRGLKLTMEISVVGILIGFLIGSVSGYALHGHFKAGRHIAGVYIWLIRGTPLVVQALYVYFVVPLLISAATGTNFTLESTAAGIIVISLNSGAFISTIVKGALDGVEIGQTEAGKSLGLTNRQIMWHLIVPPAFQSMLPALFNQFIISVKDTALLSIISVNEMTRQTQNYIARTFQTVPAYTVCALFYLVLLSILMVLQKFIEKKFSLK
ncbi:MAG: amino acid ABC transporter permease [Ruminococcaceae bacterium]|nr:amino acid ABC transporter permease [Oscillospiraceae bacterium]